MVYTSGRDIQNIPNQIAPERSAEANDHIEATVEESLGMFLKRSASASDKRHLLLCHLKRGLTKSTLKC